MLATLASSALALRVGVLGVSTTNGCGACGAEGELPGCNGTTGRCVWERGWAGIVAQSHQLEVYAKNAAGPLYLARCIGARLSHDREVVLVDVLTNVFHGSSELKQLLHNVHRFAPGAHVAFVGWYAWRTAARQWTESSILDVPVVRVWEQPPSQSFYSRDNANVHPNAKGHRMIADAVLKYLEWPDRWRREPHGPQLRATHEEVCMGEHELLELTRGAEIVDLGGDKGIAKEVVQAGEQGAVTRIKDVHRGVAHLTYLLRPRGDREVMNISCSCECSPLPGHWSMQLFPFPHVPVDQLVAADPSVRAVPTRSGVLDTTAFRVRNDGCNVTITMPRVAAITRFSIA